MTMHRAYAPRICHPHAEVACNPHMQKRREQKRRLTKNLLFTYWNKSHVSHARESGSKR
jgi:hypothetical protein